MTRHGPKALLAEAGYPDGFEFTIVTATAGSAQLAPISNLEFLHLEQWHGPTEHQEISQEPN